MISDQDRDLIRAYVSGQLDEKTRRRVEERIATDDEFRRELMAERELQKDRDLKTRGEAPRYESRNRAEGSGPIQPEVAPGSGRWWLIAVGIALLGVVAYYVIDMQQPGGPGAELFNSYFEPYPLSLYETVREGQEIFPDAFKAYRQADYDEAVARFEASEPKMSSSPAYMFYYAVALLANGEGDEAGPILQDLLQEEKSPMIAEPASWYLALAHLETGDEEGARQQLREITAKDTHTMHDEATSLLGELGEED